MGLDVIAFIFDLEAWELIVDGLYFLQKQYIDLRWWSVVAAALARLSIGCRACVFALRSDY